MFGSPAARGAGRAHARGRARAHPSPSPGVPVEKLEAAARILDRGRGRARRRVRLAVRPGSSPAGRQEGGSGARPPQGHRVRRSRERDSLPSWPQREARTSRAVRPQEGSPCGARESRPPAPRGAALAPPRGRPTGCTGARPLRVRCRARLRRCARSERTSDALPRRIAPAKTLTPPAKLDLSTEIFCKSAPLRAYRTRSAAKEVTPHPTPSDQPRPQRTATPRHPLYIYNIYILERRRRRRRRVVRYPGGKQTPQRLSRVAPGPERKTTPSLPKNLPPGKPLRGRIPVRRSVYCSGKSGNGAFSLEKPWKSRSIYLDFGAPLLGMVLR